MKDSSPSFWRTPNGIAALALIAGVLYFLLTEHRAHFFGALPYLILLLCPVMHIFMHRGHGGHGSHSKDAEHSEDRQMDHSNAYGLWSLVFLNSAIFIIFAFSFAKPQSKRDWRSLGAFSAFVVALFTEMYGFPLTIYLLSGWLTANYPELDVFSHEAGHLWNTLFGWDIDAHFDPFHILSHVFIIGGFFLLAAAWRVLHAAQREHALASTGIYARIRHPQYVAFILIMFGFLLQWPTLPTLVMFPILVYVYVRLARHEEKIALEEFGDRYRDYMATTPAFLPVWQRRESTAQACAGVDKKQS